MQNAIFIYLSCKIGDLFVCWNIYKFDYEILHSWEFWYLDYHCFSCTIFLHSFSFKQNNQHKNFIHSSQGKTHNVQHKLNHIDWSLDSSRNHFVRNFMTFHDYEDCCCSAEIIRVENALNCKLWSGNHSHD